MCHSVFFTSKWVRYWLKLKAQELKVKGLVDDLTVLRFKLLHLPAFRYVFTLWIYLSSCSDNLYQMTECVTWNPVNSLTSTVKRYDISQITTPVFLPTAPHVSFWTVIQRHCLCRKWCSEYKRRIFNLSSPGLRWVILATDSLYSGLSSKGEESVSISSQLQGFT